MPTYFIKLVSGKILLWDYESQRQYEITQEEMTALLEHHLTDDDSTRTAGRDICEEFERANLLRRNGGQMDAWGGGMLSRMFHLGTQVTLEEGSELIQDSEAEYIQWSSQIAQTPVNFLLEREGARYDLPDPQMGELESMSLWQALVQRRTTRDFLASDVTLQQVANILYATFGFVHGMGRTDLANGGFVSLGNRRTSPSAGSLQATEAYLIAKRVSGLEPAIYHHQSHAHKLVRIRDDFDQATLGGLLGGQAYANDLGFGVILTTRFDRLFWKYPGDRAYRMALTELGCLAQTFQLSATASGLNSWLTGCLYEREWNSLLRVDQVDESAMFFLGAGIGTGQPFSRRARELAISSQASQANMR
ncbi:SagB/ThcOx family dehydrogenase [Paraburkholderia sp. 2C]